PQNYVKTVKIENYWNLDEKAFVSLGSTDCLISESMSSNLKLKIGDTIDLNESSFTIKGTFLGLGGANILLKQQNIIILNKQFSTSEKSGSYLIKLSKADYDTTANLYNYTKAIDPNIAFSSKINVLPPVANPGFDFVLFLIKILDVEAVLLVFVALLGLSLMMIIRIRERTKEIGSWRSRGMSNLQLIQSIVIETLTIVTLGLIVGFIAGFGLTFGLQGIILQTIFQTASVVPLDVIFPLQLWILIGLMFIGALVLGVFVALWATLKPISEQIRYEDYI
ncbi:MAG: ABC transporter permease, partial [Candidatus Thorarchaeota archaeon]